MWGSGMNLLITTQAWTLKGQPDESEYNWQTWRAGGNPSGRLSAAITFSFANYRGRGLSADLWADAGLSSVLSRGLDGVRDLEYWMFFEGEEEFLCYPAQVTPPGCWYRLISIPGWSFLKWKWSEGEMLKNSHHHRRTTFFCVASPLWINLTWDCMLHKQTQNNFLTKLPARVDKEMEGNREYPRVPSIHNSAPGVKFWGALFWFPGCEWHGQHKVASDRDEWGE